MDRRLEIAKRRFQVARAGLADTGSHIGISQCHRSGHDTPLTRRRRAVIGAAFRTAGGSHARRGQFPIPRRNESVRYVTAAFSDKKMSVQEMLSYLQAVFLGLLQGISELFPVSSLGHSVIIPKLLDWQLDQSSDGFVSFIVCTHLATSLVLLGFFWGDWVKIIRGMFRSLRQREIRRDDTYARIGWLLVVSTIPAGLLGILFEERLKTLFAAADIVAVVLVLNGVVLYAVELVRRHRAEGGSYDDGRIAALSWRQSVTVGLFQCLALVPGFSRTGLTMVGGMLAGQMSHENSARYSFLLATPIILAAAVLKVPDIFAHGGAGLGPALIGAVCSAMSAYVSVRFLLRYFETRTLRPFAVYCAVAGVAALLLLHR